jgi:hypothetical protein
MISPSAGSAIASLPVCGAAASCAKAGLASSASNAVPRLSAIRADVL